MGTLILPIATQLLAVLLLFIYFSKKRLNTKENKIYSKMLIINFVCALMAIITFLYAKTYEDDFVISIMQKIYMSLMLLLIINILIYNISILNIKDSIKKSLNMIIRFSSVILIIVVFITPLHVINKGDILDGYGLSYDIVLGATVLYFILIIISIIVIFIKNKSGFTKDIPFICLIVLYIAGLLIRDSYPSIMFENYLFTKKPKNKSTAIKEIIEMYSIDRENVYTVGNAQNDYEMIKDYNGYNMLISNPILYKNSKGTVSSVKQLVKKINN